MIGSLLVAFLAAAPAPPPLCVLPTTGQVVNCADPQATPLCWDALHRRIDTCAHVAADRPDQTWRYVIHAGIAHGADLLSTDFALRNGAVERNPFIPTVESRVGMKFISASAQVATMLLLDKVLHKPKAALWTSRAVTAVFIGVALHNINTGQRAAERRAPATAVGFRVRF